VVAGSDMLLETAGKATRYCCSRHQSS